MVVLLWVHLTAAVIWIGGMVFLSLVLVPVLKQDGLSGERRLLLQAVGRRFRPVVWASIGVLVATGPVLATLRVSDATASDWSSLFTLKLGLVALAIALTAAHDFWLGPRVLRERGSPSTSGDPLPAAIVQLSTWLPRTALLVALIILGLGVALVKM